MDFLRSPRLVRFLTLGVIVFLTGTLKADTYEEALIRDLFQTVQARKVLQDDPQLAPWNLGVKVTNRVAVLWGPAPSQELSFRAEQRLRGMFELIDVRNGLSIEPDHEAAPLVSPVQDLPRYLPDQAPSSVPSEPRRPVPLIVPGKGVDLAGIVTPEETRTAHSSPLGISTQVEIGQATLHIPFLGSITLPR